MSGAPDFLEPVIGFRAWHVDPDGHLAAWSFATHRWSPGANDARCLTHPAHRPPVASCMCGLYALTDPADRRLDFRADQAVGAIAAWGDMEVHRTGFRAETACVVALALPAYATDEMRDRLERAAARYRVALVPAQELSAEALRHGAPLPEVAALPPAPVRGRHAVPVPQIDPSAFAGPARGVAADEHLWVETGLGGVVLGLTPAFADLLAADGGRLTVAGAGTRVAAGDRLGTLEGAHGALAVWAPVAGVVNAVNPRLEQDPGLLRRDPEGAGWLLRLVPTAWEHEAPALGWGPRDVALYRGGLERAADPFLDLRVGTLRAMPSPTGWQDVLGALRAERTRPRWPDATALAAELEAPILRALADPAVAGAVGRLGARVVWRVSEPDAALVLDLRPGAVRATLDADAAGPADLTLRSDATTLARWLTGDLDPAGALRRGDVVADRPPGATLRALAVLKHLRIGRLPVRASWHAPCENADGPLS